MRTIHSLILTALLLLVSSSISALTVDQLRVNGMQNPYGIDSYSPAFAWKIHSDARSSLQTAYQIVISSADGTPVFDSGMVASDESINVRLENLPLAASTRYYWTVTVTDSNGETATSDETAYFDTGLMSDDWGSATWIKATDANYGTVVVEDEVVNYTIEAEMRIDELADGICFAASDASNFYMWQVNTYNENYLLRPHRWSGGSPACLDEIPIPSEVDVSIGTFFTMRIEITDNAHLATTYINDVLIDSRDGDYYYGTFGMRSSYEYGMIETATYKSFKVSTDTGLLLIDADFSSEETNPFTNSTIVDGMLYVRGMDGGDVYSWLKTESKDIRYDVEADLTLIRDNAALVFSATSTTTYYMWQINTFNYDFPVLRCHVYNNSTSPSYADYQINGFTKDDFLNTQQHITISVDGSTIRTYVGDVLINTYEDSAGALDVGDIGMRVDNSSTEPNEQAYYDNLKVTVYDSDGNATVTVYETFEDPNDCIFLNAPIEYYNGSNQCHMATSGKEYRLMQETSDGMPIFRKEFNLAKPVQTAYLYTSALGIYDLFLNGKRVGHVQPNGETIYEELKPGWTDYKERVFYSQHEVSSLLAEGSNAVAAVVTPGWWQGEVARGYYSARNTAFIAKLVVTYDDGTQEVIDSDITWAVYKKGALRSGDIYDGEVYDARLETDYSAPGVNLGDWNAVTQDSQFRGVIQSFQGPTVRTLDAYKRDMETTTIYEGTKATGTTYGEIDVVNTLSGVQPISLKAGQTAIIDFGQNFAGWVIFTAAGESGTRLHLRFAEILNDTGASGRGNDGPGGSIYVANLRDAKAELYYTLNGNTAGETYRPSTTFWGFRYCEITSTADVEITSIYGLPISSSYIDTGTVATSSEIVNQLISNIHWGQRSNLLSVPTDCPQRDERMGWTADTQVFSMTGMYNADVAEFYHKWVTDLRDGQRDDGAYYCIAPISWTFCGQAAWSDAGIIVPWNVYLMTGDTSILAEHFASMEKYMDWLSTLGGDGYLYNGAGTDYGDWLSFASTDSRYVSVTYYAYDALLMTKMAKVLSTDENDQYAQAAAKYEELYNNIRDEYNTRYCTSTGLLKQQTQTTNLLMLKFGLYKSDEQRETAISRLSQLITNNNETLSTGFIGTAVLNQTLSSVGLNDKAYNLLLQRDCPSWLYSVDQGATTIWERWNSYTIESGFGDPSMNSFNHYAYGAVGEWMYRYMAGIDLDEDNPAYKHIILKPYIDSRETLPDGQERINSVTATYNSPYGEIDAAWTSLETQLETYTVTVPANTTATVYLPVASEETAVYEGDSDISEVAGITYVGYEDGYKVYEIGSGTYKFSVDVATGIKKVDASDYTFGVEPNPFTTTLTICSTDTINSVDLYNMSGMKVASVPQVANNVLDLSAIAGGSYVLRAKGEHGTYTEKVIKM